MRPYLRGNGINKLKKTRPKQKVLSLNKQTSPLTHTKKKKKLISLCDKSIYTSI